MSQLDEFNQNNLLFKKFQGVTNSDIDSRTKLVCTRVRCENVNKCV